MVATLIDCKRYQILNLVGPALSELAATTYYQAFHINHVFINAQERAGTSSKFETKIEFNQEH